MLVHLRMGFYLVLVLTVNRELTRTLIPRSEMPTILGLPSFPVGLGTVCTVLLHRVHTTRRFAARYARGSPGGKSDIPTKIKWLSW